ncbi:hypothetical protein SDC9_139679 [bioreactor metagenome]|uniref:Uncharacterized protein n=1 Tax=bioreactor metagenome TaxID=1076179 RepID=A0A645DSS7_9ZZZZ
MQHDRRRTHGLPVCSENRALAKPLPCPGANRREIEAFADAHGGWRAAGEAVVPMVVKHAVESQLVEDGGVSDAPQQAIGESVHQHGNAAPSIRERGAPLARPERAVQLVTKGGMKIEFVQMHLCVKPFPCEMPALDLLVHNRIIRVDVRVQQQGGDLPSDEQGKDDRRDQQGNGNQDENQHIGDLRLK